MKLRHIVMHICIGYAFMCIHHISPRTAQESASGSEEQKIEHTESQNEGDAVPPVKHGDLSKAMPQQRSEEERTEYKRNLAKNLVHQAIDFFKNNSIERSCRAFAEDDSWQFDEMYVFVIHESGIIYSHGKDNDLIWRHIDEARNERTTESPIDLKSNLVEVMREAARDTGWLNYEWNFDTKHAYVQEVTKDGRIFFLGTGFYPESHRFLAKELVKKAVAYAEEYGADQAFARMSNSGGMFTQGPVYLWAYDFDGVLYAHGKNIARVGLQHLDWQGEQGTYLLRELIKKLQTQEDAWADYYEIGNVLTHVYAHRFKDPKDGRQYFIGAGYYPEVDSNMVNDFVNRAVDYLKTQGPTVAFRDFTQYAGKFHKGPLMIYAYDMDGTVLADGENPKFVGLNLLKMSDEEGSDVTKEIITKAREQGEGRTTFLDKGRYKELYYKHVSLPSGDYVVGSGYWPDSKATVAQALAEKAILSIQKKPLDQALREFTTWDSDYMRGDLFVEVVTYDGIVVAYGPRLSYIWSEIDVRTEAGYTVPQVLIETARTGGGWVSYRSQGRRYNMYVKEVSKEIPTKDGSRENKFVVGVFYI